VKRITQIKTEKLKAEKLTSESGMALLMVMSSIAILTFLLADFTFETKINQIKAYNAQDRAQARLTAEAGIHFSLAKLRIYQEVRNRIEKNETLKNLIKPSQIDSVLVQPFVYPIPLDKKASNIQRKALLEFEEGTVLKGQLNVTMSQITGFLNPNNLRIPIPEPGANNTNAQNTNQNNENEGEENQTPLEVTEKKILQMLEEEIRRKREEDNLFDQLYPTLRATLLVKELKYYVNNPAALDDPEIPEIENIYSEKGLRAKHAPMASLDELYTLAGWPEMIVNLVKDRLTVHEVGFISLNDLNENTLRLIFPNITPEQSEEFFRYRDGDPELGEQPRPFQSVKEFKSLIVNQLAIVSDSDFEKRQKEFEAANLRFGVAGKLYKVKSTARFNTATVTITAFIDLPVKPQPEPSKPQNNSTSSNENPNDDPNDNPNDLENGPDTNNSTTTNQNTNKKFKIELMLPRIVEYRVD
jgi:hypothetical protein